MTRVPLKLYTIGHSTHSWPEFVKMLDANKVELLVDVRSHPGSSRHPQYNRDAMQRKLKGRYLFMGDQLGGPTDGVYASAKFPKHHIARKRFDMDICRELISRGCSCGIAPEVWRKILHAESLAKIVCDNEQDRDRALLCLHHLRGLWLRSIPDLPRNIDTALRRLVKPLNEGDEHIRSLDELSGLLRLGVRCIVSTKRRDVLLRQAARHKLSQSVVFSLLHPVLLDSPVGVHYGGPLLLAACCTPASKYDGRLAASRSASSWSYSPRRTTCAQCSRPLVVPQWVNVGLYDYAEWLASPTAQAGMAQLIQIVRETKGRVAITCSEAQWWRCHRASVADVWEGLGNHAFHLWPGGRAPQRHTLSNRLKRYTPHVQQLWRKNGKLAKTLQLS